ncbi:MAG: response regulator [Verrucomicrobia bacterium]|nr:response regulator [Verrucomicrobiota bacterium]
MEHHALAQANPGAKPGPHVLLRVKDSGCGIPSEVLDRMFEPFFTTKEQGKGTGLGLATVYGIVLQSGGHITVESEPGRGATFRIYLPRLENGADTTTLGRGPGAAPGGTETILLAEDETNVRKLARELLSSSGYTVLQAKDGNEALKVAESCQAPIHLLITDVVMPGLNSNTMVRLLRTMRPDIKVLYISGYTDTTLVSRDVIRSGAAFLQKPFSPDTLARKVRETLDAPPPQPKTKH